MQAYDFSPGDGPLLVSMPHVGGHVTAGIRERLSAAARPLPDTDWHVDILYDFLGDLGVPVIKATHSRYVVDLNRPPDDAALYPGRAGSGLVPTETFADAALYAEGDEPGPAEISTRVEKYWRPYHQRLTQELARIRGERGYAILWDAHSIRSHVPRLFDGRLPDLNFGTCPERESGASADPGLAAGLMEIANAQQAYSAVLNGRFTGGYITRHYGDPARRKEGAGAHAIQLELSQATYMNEDPPYTFDAARADMIRPLLRRLIECARDFVPR